METSRGEGGCGLQASNKGRASDTPRLLEPVGMMGSRDQRNGGC